LYHFLYGIILFHVLYHFYIPLSKTSHSKTSFFHILSSYHELNHLHRKPSNTRYHLNLYSLFLIKQTMVNRYRLFLYHETHLYTIVLHMQPFHCHNTIYHIHSSYYLSNYHHNIHHLCSKILLLRSFFLLIYTHNIFHHFHKFLLHINQEVFSVRHLMIISLITME